MSTVSTTFSKTKNKIKLNVSLIGSPDNTSLLQLLREMREVNRTAIYNEICPLGQVKYAYANEMRMLPNEPRRDPRLVLIALANFISRTSVASTFHDEVISRHASDISSKKPDTSF